MSRGLYAIGGEPIEAPLFFYHLAAIYRQAGQDGRGFLDQAPWPRPLHVSGADHRDQQPRPRCHGAQECDLRHGDADA